MGHMKKVECFEFDPVIYPRKLWIMVTNNPNDIYADFQNPDNPDTKIDDNAFNKYGAFTCRAERKSDLILGVLIVFGSKKSIDIKTIAHESFHAVEYISDDVGLQVTDEQAAYLIGWCAECCDKVKRT